MNKTGKRGIINYKKDLRLDAPPTLRHEGISRRQERYSIKNNLRKYKGRISQ